MRVAILAIMLTIVVGLLALNGMETVPSPTAAKSETKRIQSPSSIAAVQEPESQTRDLSHDRYGYAKRLERALLSNGISADVTVLNDSELVIWMPLTKARVYQAALEGKVLQNAYDRKFKAVNFWDRIGNEHWYFDIANGIPKCDRVRRLCF